MSDWNRYVGTAAASEAEAREVITTLCHDEPVALVHVEAGEEEGELSTFVFTFWDEVLVDADEEEWLHDLFDLPVLINRPIEIV